MLVQFLGTTVLADENAESAPSGGFVNAPRCLSFDDIGKNPEVIIEERMKKLSDEEVKARLIFAETLASTCPSKDVARGIAKVIQNRVQANNGKAFGVGRGVVFKRAQFRSSTGSCDVAQRKAFLCPTSSAHYEKVWAYAIAAEREWRGSPTSGVLAGADKYFFNKHFDESKNCAKFKGVQPDWAKPSREVDSPEVSVGKSCIQFYR